MEGPCGMHRGGRTAQNCRRKKSNINVIMRNWNQTWVLWPAPEIAIDITAEEGDMIEAFDFKMTVIDQN